MALKATKLVGKSRLAIWEVNGFNPQTTWVRIVPAANDTFLLPQGVELSGKVIVANPSAVAQAAVTVGTAAAGTQITAGLIVAAGGASGVIAGTKVAPLYVGGNRTIFVESAAWQKGVVVLLEAIELPMRPDTTAKS